MASGDRADPVGHGDDRTAKGEGNTELADMLCSAEYGSAASE
jgi:hypothetical protein